MKQRTNVSKATTKAPAPKTVSVTKSGYNNSYAWSGYEQAQKRNTGTGTAATSSSRSSGTTRSGGSTRSSGSGGAASSAPAYTPPVSIAASVSGIASGVSEAAKRAEDAKRAAEAKRLEQARADYIKRRLAELKPQGVYSAPQQASAQKKGYNNNYAWSGYEQAQKGVKTSSGQATTTQSQQPTYNNTSTPKQTSHLGGVSKPDDPAGFVSQFGSDFKLSKNPFAIIKPDGTSDLAPKQQEEAAAIFSNVFDGESYYNYKLQEAAKNIASRFGAKSATPSSAKPQSAWDEHEETRAEQVEWRKNALNNNQKVFQDFSTLLKNCQQKFAAADFDLKSINQSEIHGLQNAVAATIKGNNGQMEGVSVKPINPALKSQAFKKSNELHALIEKTILQATDDTTLKGTFGFGIVGSAQAGGRVSASSQIVFDRHGNWGITLSGAVGGGMLSADASTLFSFTSADNIYDLTGVATETGASVSGPVIPINSIGIEGIVAGSGYGGLNINVGLSASGLIPFEYHTEVSETTVLSTEESKTVLAQIMSIRFPIPLSASMKIVDALDDGYRWVYKKCAEMFPSHLEQKGEGQDE